MSKPGLIYSSKMCDHCQDDHPESPDRISEIFKEFVSSKTINYFEFIKTRTATPQELLTVHDSYHVQKMSLINTYNDDQLRYLESTFNSVYLNKDSYQSASIAAGCTIELCDQVVSSHVSNGIAIVRPPGHHAEGNTAMGFCIFNNVAIAAECMIKKHGLKRIAIIDWDAHHGNATQKTFYNRSDVLYISLHQYDKGAFYPGKSGDPGYIGGAKGYNINIGWTTKNTHIGDNEYQYAFEKLIIPVLKEYEPELIIVSAGFDSADGEKLADLHLSPTGYNYMTTELLKINSKLVIVLEGGYQIPILIKSMMACARALLGQTDNIIPKEISSSAIKDVFKTIKYHQPYWTNLN